MEKFDAHRCVLVSYVGHEWIETPPEMAYWDPRLCTDAEARECLTEAFHDQTVNDIVRFVLTDCDRDACDDYESLPACIKKFENEPHALGLRSTSLHFITRNYVL